jgi:hypothetical protein
VWRLLETKVNFYINNTGVGVTTLMHKYFYNITLESNSDLIFKDGHSKEVKLNDQSLTVYGIDTNGI